MASHFVCQEATAAGSLEVMPAQAHAGWGRFLPPFREDIDTRRFAREYAGRSVLVTGAAGSIGSALARVLAGAHLKKLLLLDCDEAGLREIAGTLENAAADVVPGDIADPGPLKSLLGRHRVDIIFHAAARKHVPQLEREPFSAAGNNALGTYVLAQAARKAQIPELLLVSTDKAVNPRSIMGASKRMAELAVASLSNGVCRMNAIRLCNVIGSSGSVVPIFLEQIEKGRPVTVTDPRASRWFVTMGEAVSAILAAGLTAERGKILLPQVADPVCIGDLARFLIQSAEKDLRPAREQSRPRGDWPGQVKYMGLRAGEKLAEELTLAAERHVGQDGNLVVIETPAPSCADLNAVMDEVGACIARQDLSGLLRMIQSIVPEYQPSGHLLEQAAAAGVRP